MHSFVFYRCKLARDIQATCKVSETPAARRQHELIRVEDRQSELPNI